MIEYRFGRELLNYGYSSLEVGVNFGNRHFTIGNNLVGTTGRLDRVIVERVG
jgi:hypothetical protein